MKTFSYIYLNNVLNLIWTVRLHSYSVLYSLPSQSVLPWAECPINSNRTGPIEECERATPTQYFFFRETLNISPSIEENGGIHTGQALCLLLAWMITYLFIVRGVKSTGKVRKSLKLQILGVYTLTGTCALPVGSMQCPPGPPVPAHLLQYHI